LLKKNKLNVDIFIAVVWEIIIEEIIFSLESNAIHSARSARNVTLDIYIIKD